MASASHALVDQLHAVLDGLAALDVHDLPDIALVNGVEELLVAESRLRAAQARWLGVADRREATVAECGRATRSWLIEENRLGAAEAGRRVNLARRLPAHPQVESA